MNGPPMQKPKHHEFVDAKVIHDTDVIVREGVPRPVALERPRRLAARTRCADRT